VRKALREAERPPPSQQRTPASQRCVLCEGSAFFHITLVDQVTARRFHLYRCISCDNQQWASASEDQGVGPSASS
jgi:hypothetical protein